MWDRIPKLNTYNHMGRQSLEVMRLFSEKYTQTLQNFAIGLKECAVILDSSAFLKPAKHTTVAENQPPTLEHSVHWVRGGLDSLSAEIEERATQLLVDTKEPIENFQVNYTTESTQKI